MKKETKAYLTLLVKEVQDCKDMDEVRKLLDGWIIANDLHPELVVTMGKEEFQKWRKKQ